MDRRRRIALVSGLGAAALVAATVGLVVANGQGETHHFVGTRGGKSPSLGVSTTAPGESSTTGVASTATATTGTQVPPAGAPTTVALSGSSWQVGPTTGLTNLAAITFTASGVPPGSYYVGQCPAGAVPGVPTCVLNHVVTVTDGTLTGDVHAFWWMAEGKLDCGRAPGTCVVGVVSATPGSTFTPVSFPISFDPARRPRITVTPDHALTDGQSVVVHGVDVGEGTVQIQECLLAQWASCAGPDVKSQADGTFGTAMTARRRLEWGGHGAGSGTCGVDGDCVIEVWLTPKGFDSSRIWINPDQPVALQFAPAPTSTTPTTSTTAG